MLLGLSSSADTQALIAAAAARYGLSPSLLAAVAQAESGGNQAAVSSAGAIGIMQLMPGTAAQYGDNPYDPAQNVDAGAHYLSDMLARYNGDTSLALAAYNAGPGNVDSYGGIPPFTETQNYVNTVLANAGDLGDGTDYTDYTSTTPDLTTTAVLAAAGIAALFFFVR